jgi:predicted Zn finger-like uncharacterized protein
MPAALVGCPSCKAQLRLSAMPPAGQVINCPKCGTTFAPTAVVQAIPQVIPAVTAVATAAPAPRRPPPDRDEEPDDDRPRKSRKRKVVGGKRGGGAGLGITMLLVLGGLALVVVLTCGGGAIWWFASRSSAPVVVNVNPGGGNPFPGGGNPAPVGEWRTVNSERGKFSIDLPGVVLDDKFVPGSDKIPVVQATGDLRNNKVIVQSSPRDDIDKGRPAQTVADSRSEVGGGMKKTPLNLGGHPGVEGTSADGNRIVRVYVTPNRIYVVTVQSIFGASLDRSIADRAFNSFRITE